MRQIFRQNWIFWDWNQIFKFQNSIWDFKTALEVSGINECDIVWIQFLPTSVLYFLWLIIWIQCQARCHEKETQCTYMGSRVTSDVEFEGAELTFCWFVFPLFYKKLRKEIMPAYYIEDCRISKKVTAVIFSKWLFFFILWSFHKPHNQVKCM